MTFLRLLPIVVALVASSVAAAPPPSSSCSRDQHAQWLETCLFVIADVVPSEDPKDPWSILMGCPFYETKRIIPELMTACRARFDRPSEIGEHLWQVRPDLLDRLSACDWTDHEQWLRGCLEPLYRLQLSGTKVDVLHHFGFERATGGPEIFVSRQCPFVKAQVWFETDADVAEPSAAIREIAPYFGYPNDGCWWPRILDRQASPDSENSQQERM